MRKPGSQEKKVIYAFIDSQNLNLGVRSMGWELDFGKFRLYLKNKYDVSRAFLFLGYIKENKSMYAGFRRMAYELIFKPTFKGPDNVVKGNVDAELVLHTMIEFQNYDKEKK